jgi:hypothetical protein
MIKTLELVCRQVPIMNNVCRYPDFGRENIYDR